MNRNFVIAASFAAVIFPTLLVGIMHWFVTGSTDPTVVHPASFALNVVSFASIILVVLVTFWANKNFSQKVDVSSAE